MASDIVFNTVGNKERLVDRVANQIKEMIMESRLEAGQRLPPERELSEKIGVSRTVIREAVKTLIAMGLVETRQGVGTIVRQINSDQLSEQLNILMQARGFSLDHLHQVRQILEVETAGMAAGQATPDEIAQLTAIVERMESVPVDSLAYTEADTEFHRCLASMAHNPLLVLLLDSISDILRSVRLSVAKFPDLVSAARPDHRRILDHIRQSDVQGARQSMTEHLLHARKIQDALLEREN